MPFAPTRRWLAPLVALVAVPVVGLLTVTPADASPVRSAGAGTASPAGAVPAGQAPAVVALYPPGCGRGDVQHWDAYNTYTYTQGGACQASPDNKHFVQFQNDGNLVVYNASTSTNRATWASKTNGLGRFLYFGADGRVAVWDSNRIQRWENGVRMSSAWLFTLVMQNDGNLVEYAQPRTGGAQHAVWNTHTNGH